MGGLRQRFALRFGRHTVGSSSHQDGLLVNNAGPSPFQWRVQSDERHRWQLHLLNEQIPRQRWWALLIWIAVFVSEIIVRIGSALVTQTSQHVTLVAYSIPPIPFRLLFGGNESEVYQWVEEAWPRTLEQRWPTQDETWLVATVAGSRVVGSRVPNAMDRVYWMPLIVVCMCLVLSLLPLRRHSLAFRHFYALQMCLVLVYSVTVGVHVWVAKRAQLCFWLRVVPVVRDLGFSPPGHPLTKLVDAAFAVSPIAMASVAAETGLVVEFLTILLVVYAVFIIVGIPSHLSLPTLLFVGIGSGLTVFWDSTPAVYTGGILVPTSSTPLPDQSIGDGATHHKDLFGGHIGNFIVWSFIALLAGSHHVWRSLRRRWEVATKLHNTNEQLRRKEVKLQYEHHSVTSEHALLRRDNDQMRRRLSSAGEISSASDTLPGYESFAPQPAEATAAERGWVKAEFDGVTELLTSWRILPQHLRLHRLVTRSVEYEGFHGTLDNTEVAIKRLVPVGLTRPRVGRFRREVQLLSQLVHPNIVQFIGACCELPHLCVVTEWMSGSTLRQLLREAAGSDFLGPLDWSSGKKKMAADAARGMCFLHSWEPPLIHGALNTLNLMVDDGLRVKVANFDNADWKQSPATVTSLAEGEGGGAPADSTTASAGITRQVPLEHGADSRLAEWAFIPPEQLLEGALSEAVDAYAFGAVLWELDTQSAPWGGGNSASLIYSVVHSQQRLAFDAACPAAIAALATQCMCHDPTARPTFQQIMQQLEKMTPAMLTPLPSPFRAATTTTGMATASMTANSRAVSSPEVHVPIMAPQPTALPTPFSGGGGVEMAVTSCTPQVSALAASPSVPVEVVGPVTKLPKKPLSLQVPSVAERAARMIVQPMQLGKTKSEGTEERSLSARTLGSGCSTPPSSDGSTSGSTPIDVSSTDSIQLERLPTHTERRERYSARLQRWQEAYERLTVS